MNTLKHKGVVYYALPDDKGKWCSGCAFEGQGQDSANPCPQEDGDNACIAPRFRHNSNRKASTSIFITESEYLKRRLKGTL